jgi:hypothetical protein
MHRNSAVVDIGVKRLLSLSYPFDRRNSAPFGMKSRDLVRVLVVAKVVCIEF